MASTLKVQMDLVANNKASAALQQVGASAVAMGNQVTSASNTAAASLGKVKAASTGVGDMLKYIGGYITFRGLISSVGESVKGLESLYEASVKTGFSIRILSAVQNEMARTGGSFNQFLVAARQFENAVVFAIQRTGRQRDAFQALGISVDELRAKKPDELLTATAKRFSELESGAGRAQIATALLGLGAQKSVPALVEMGKSAEDATRHIESLGAGIDESMAIRAHEAFQAVSDLSTAWGSVKRNVIDANLPGITRDVEALALALGNSSKDSHSFGESIANWRDQKILDTSSAISQVYSWLLQAELAMVEVGRVFESAGNEAYDSVVLVADEVALLTRQLLNLAKTKIGLAPLDTTALEKSIADAKARILAAQSVDMDAIRKQVESENPEVMSKINAYHQTAEADAVGTPMNTTNKVNATMADGSAIVIELTKHIQEEGEAVTIVEKKNNDAAKAARAAATEVSKLSQERQKIIEQVNRQSLEGIKSELIAEDARARSLGLSEKQLADYRTALLRKYRTDVIAILEQTKRDYEDAYKLQIANLEAAGAAMDGFKAGLLDVGHSAGTQFDQVRKGTVQLIDGTTRSMADNFQAFVTGAKTGKAAFADFSAFVINEIIKIGLEMALINPLKTLLGGGGSTSGFGGLSSIAGAIFGGGTNAAPTGGGGWGGAMLGKGRGDAMAVPSVGRMESKNVQIMYHVNTIDSRGFASYLQSRESQDVLTGTINRSLASNTNTRTAARRL